MKRLTFLIPIAAAMSILSIMGCRKTSIDTSLFTVEEVDGVRYIHNHHSQRGYASGVKLELLGKIGKLEGEEEKDILFDPVDAARLPNGDILILERRGCTVKRYNNEK